MNDIAVANCPECHNVSSHRIPQPFNVVNATPNTLGGLAEKNRRQLGDNYCQEKMGKYKEDLKSNATFKGSLPDGTSIINKPAPVKTWYRPDKSTPDMALLKASPEQLKNYVITGKRPANT